MKSLSLEQTMLKDPADDEGSWTGRTEQEGYPSTMNRSGRSLLRGEGGAAAHHDGTDLERLLSETRQNTDGTMAVLAIVFALFCFIWAPVMVRRCRGSSRRSRDGEAADMARFEVEARAMRATLQRMSMMGNLMAEQQQRDSLRGDGGSATPFGNEMQQHRREFLDNALLTKKIIFRSEEDAQNDKRNQNEKQQDDKIDTSESNKERKLPKRQKSDVIVLISSTGAKLSKADSSLSSKKKSTTCQDESTPKSNEGDDNNHAEKKQPPEAEEQGSPAESSPPTTISFNGLQEELEPCSICLTEYSDGDEICWSQNDKCNHFFHKECILSWLLNHEECPCCRSNFLCLWGDEDGSSAGRYLHHHHRSTLMASSSASARDTSSLDWASELAEEINLRILQRQRQLHVELERRERELQLQQLELQLSTTSLSPPSAARGMIGIPQRSLTERNLSLRNHVTVSVDDLASGLLLYRHFPMQFASDPRRLAPQPRAPGASSLARSPRNNDEDDEDIQVAHFGLASSHYRGLEPWQTYHHDIPSSLLEVDPWVVATSRRAMPSTRLSLNLPTALAATALSSTRATPSSPRRSDDPPASAQGSNDGDQQRSDDDHVDDDGVVTVFSA